MCVDTILIVGIRYRNDGTPSGVAITVGENGSIMKVNKELQ
ncbi:MAG: hypothetical protein PWP31_1992 [Clostridia bacterium]|nr:hypothetical protein [Clostridia bacterium]